MERIEASPLGYRLAKGAFWSIAGGLISRVLGLASSILVARMLGKEGFGQLAIVYSTLGMFGPLAGFQLGLTSTKFVAEFRETDPAKAGRIMALSGVVAWSTGAISALILILVAPWMALHTLAAPHLGGLLQISAVVILFGALSGAQIGALAGFEAFQTIAWLTLLSGVASFALMVGGVYWGGLRGAVCSLVVSAALTWILNHWALRREAARAGVPLILSGTIREWRVLWRFSLPSVLASMAHGPTSWVCNALLVNQVNGYAEMGIYSAANQWRTAILLLPSIIGPMLLPILSNLRGKKDHGRYNKALWYNVLLSVALAMAIAIPLAVFSRRIMSAYGEGFREGGWVLVLMLIVGVAMAANSIVGQGIASAGKMWTDFLLYVFQAGTLLLLALLLVPSHLAIGLAGATAVSYVLLVVAKCVYVRNLTRPR